MHLSDIQSDAYATAEAKGLHRNLELDAPVTDREHALILLARLHQQLDTVTQLVKRHGITDDSYRAIHDALYETDESLQWFLDSLEMGCLAQRSGCTRMSQSAASLIRLALMHTEVSEASEILPDVNADLTPETCTQITEEIADVVIRGADLVATIGDSLDKATELKLVHNKTREYGYGTPLSQQEKP
jgi:hypothetical protein